MGEWKNVRLGDVADVNWGDTSTTKASYVSHGFPAYSATGPDGFLSYSDYDRTGVVLSAIGANCGKTWLAKGKWSCIKNTIRFWSTSADVDTEFLFWATSDPQTWPQRGSAQAFISQGDARNVNVSIPPLPIQRRIAHILGTLDDRIELNRRMNRTLEKMAAAIFKSWFIDFDPVRAKTEGRDPGLPADIGDLFPDSFEESELGTIPKGWTSGSLGDVAGSPRRGVNPADVPPTTPYIGLEHMPRRCIALDDWGRAEDVASGKSQFRQGEILFGKLRPYFHKVGIAPIDGVCSTDIVVVTPKSKDWHGYVISLVSSKAFVDYTDSHSAGTKMPRTNWNDMCRYPLARPPEPLAKAFQRHVADFHRRILLNVRQNRRLSGLRDTLLPKLMSGEIEVTDIDRHSSMGAT